MNEIQESRPNNSIAGAGLRTVSCFEKQKLFALKGKATRQRQDKFATERMY